MTLCWNAPSFTILLRGPWCLWRLVTSSKPRYQTRRASRATYASWLSLLAADTTQSSAERGHRAGWSGQRLWGRHYKMCVFYNVSAVHSIGKSFFIEPRRKAPTWFVSCSDVTQARTWKPFFWEEINRRQNNGMIYLAPPCFQWLNVTALFCQGWGLLIKIGNVNRCHLFYASVFVRVLFIIVHHCCSTRKSVLSLTGFRELQRSVNTMKNKLIH